jgi:hypothetical protein
MHLRGYPVFDFCGNSMFNPRLVQTGVSEPENGRNEARKAQK